MSSNTAIENGSNVNVTIDDEIIIGTVVKIFKNGKARVEFDDGTKKTFPADAIELRRPGRRKLMESLSDEEREAQVSTLLEALGSETVQSAKKNIRAALRRLGHKGGLNAQTTADDE